MKTTGAFDAMRCLLGVVLLACGSQTAAVPDPEPAAPAASAPAASGQAEPAAPTFRLPESVAPVSYQAMLTLDPSQATFAGSIAIAVDLRQPVDVIWLSAEDLTIANARVAIAEQTLAARAIDAQQTGFVGVALPRAIGPGPATVHIDYQGAAETGRMDGVFRQEEGDEHYLFSQFEATSARQAFPCFDEPHFKTPWQLTLIVRAEHEAFSNTPVAATAARDDGWKAVTFARTKPLPSYLVAFAVGPFDVVDGGTAGRNRTPLRYITPRGRTADTRFAAATTPHILQLLEDYFDMPYPYEKLDSVAVPSFFGAMENPGLVTYAQRIMLAEPASETVKFHRTYAGVAAHELAHQWFGNLVTMRWWDDLWLNESFADWMAAKIVMKWKPDWRGELFLVMQRERAMEADGLRTARPVRQPVESRDDIFGAGGAILYAKGSTVLGMFERWIGEEAFQRGIRAYMRKHAWANATAADFFAAIGAESSAEITEAFATFIDQPGTPLVTAALRCEKGAPPALTVSQGRFERAATAGGPGSESGSWHIPICARYGLGKKQGRECMLLKDRQAVLALPGADHCPDWVIANDAAAGYYRVEYQGNLLEKLLLEDRGRRLTLPERTSAIGDMSALVGAGRLPAGYAFTLVPRLLSDPNPHIVGSTLRIVKSVDQFLVPDALRPRYARFVRKLYGKQAHRIGWRPVAGEDADTRLLRPDLLAAVAMQGEDPALTAQARELATAWLEDRDAVDTDLVDAVLEVASAHGDRAFYDRLLAKAKATTSREDRVALLGAMASFRDPALVERGVEIVLGDEFELLESSILLRTPLESATTRETAYRLIKENFAAIRDELPALYAKYLLATASAFCDDAHYQDAKAFFTDKAASMIGGPAALDKALAEVETCAAYRSAQQPSVTRFLEGY
jgi:alanyl aminopeptidase